MPGDGALKTDGFTLFSDAIVGDGVEFGWMGVDANTGRGRWWAGRGRAVCGGGVRGERELLSDCCLLFRYCEQGEVSIMRDVKF